MGVVSIKVSVRPLDSGRENDKTFKWKDVGVSCGKVMGLYFYSDVCGYT